MNTYPINQDYDEDYDYEPFDFSDEFKTDEICPKCGGTLYYATFGTSPDDYTSGVICKDCKWYDTD